MKVKYTYRIHGFEGTVEKDSESDAVAQAYWDEDNNTAYPVRIEAMDGSFCHERCGQLDVLMDEYGSNFYD